MAWPGAPQRGATTAAHTAPGFERIPLEPFAIGLVFFASVNLGAKGAAGALLCFLCMMASRWRDTYRLMADNWPFLLFPLFAVLSFAWSDLPLVSLRYGIQLLLTVLMALIIARTIPLARLPLIIWIGTALACALGLLSGRTGPSAEGFVLIGLSGSKNHFAYVGVFWLLSSLAVTLTARYSWVLRAAAALCILPAAFVVFQANATTALITAVFASALLLLLIVFKWFPPGFRLFCTVIALVVGAALSTAAPQISQFADRARADVLEKDSTLTGRTVLWDHADRFISEQPVIGHGYKAVWFGPEGGGLLKRFDKRDPRGFNFHDTFREIAVDLGYLGLALFGIALLLAGLKMIGVLVFWTGFEAHFAAVTAIAVVLRMKVESVLNPFSLDVVILFASFAYLWSLRIPSAFPARGLASRPQHRRTGRVANPAAARFRPFNTRRRSLR